jgi:hypothetical protein
VRSLVSDALDRGDVEELGRLCQAILDRIDACRD